MDALVKALIDNIKAAKKDSLEQVEREIAAYKKERDEELSGRDVAHEIGRPIRTDRDDCGGSLGNRPENFFACSIDESCGFEDECICDDLEAKPWQNCPIHGNVIE